LHFRSPFLHQQPPHRLRACCLPYVTHGQIFPRARGRRFPGPVVHPRVAVPPQRCSWLSTGKRADHDVATGDPDPEPQPLLGWQLFCSATGSEEGSLQTHCLLARPTPAVFSYQKNRHGPAASACKLKSMMEKMIFHTKFYETPHGSAKSIF